MDSSVIYPGLYPFGEGIDVSLSSEGVIQSFTLNTRDVYSPGASDYILLGPGSSVWTVGYSIRASTPFPFTPVANPLGLELQLQGAYQVMPVFIFGTEQQLILPVYQFPAHFAGRARVESPLVQWLLINNTGSDLTVSYQFWGKAL